MIKKIFPLKKVDLQTKKKDSTRSSEENEIRNAVNTWLHLLGVSRFSPFRREALYRQPWYLVVGPRKSGKSSLFTHSGIDFRTYPARLRNGESNPEVALAWRFSDNAVWLDLNGELLSSAFETQFGNIIQILGRVRPQLPVNGIVLVVPCTMILNATKESISDIALKEKRIIERLVEAWGIEIPVYLVLSRTDEVGGFNELFFDPKGRLSDGLLGVAIDSPDAQSFPLSAFLLNFKTFSANLDDIRMHRMTKENDEKRRSAMCRFSIDIAGMRKKTSLFVQTLFERNPSRGGARFGGFFFTSCQQLSQAGVIHPDEDVNLRSHPLYMDRESPDLTVRKRSFFVRPLLTRIIPENSGEINATRNRYKKDLFKMLLSGGIAAFVAITIIAFLIGASVRVGRDERKAAALLSVPVQMYPDGLILLAAIDSLYSVYEHYHNSRPFHMFITRYDVSRAFNAIAQNYRHACKVVLIDFWDALLERSINDHCAPGRGDFKSLKDDLRAYCSITSQRWNYQEWPREDSLAQITVMSIMRKNGAGVIGQRIDPATVKRILSRSFFFVRDNHEWTKKNLMADEQLVVRARQRLSDLMTDKRQIYRFIIEREINGQCPVLDVPDIIADQSGESILHNTRKLSAVYTPDYWHSRLLSRFESAKDELNDMPSWITGGVSVPLSSFSQQQAKVLDLTALYLDDVTAQWRNFFSAIRVDSISSPEAAEVIFRQLGSEKSSLNLLLRRFEEWTGKFTINDSLLPGSKELFDAFVTSNRFYQIFVKSNGQEYSRRLSGLADGLSKSRARQPFSSIFNGSDNDPLVVVCTYIEESVKPLIAETGSDSIVNLFSIPLQNIGIILADSLRKELNSIWRANIYTRIVDGYRNRYPFSSNDEDASFDDVREFFRSSDGMFWKTVDECFSHRIAQRSDGQWVELQKPGVHLVFTNAFFTALNHASRIESVFFTPEKNTQRWTFVVFPGKVSGNSKARFIIDGTEHKFEPGKAVRISWPRKNGDASDSLLVNDAFNNTGFFLFDGPWSVMRLLEGQWPINNRGRRYQTEFPVEWKITAHAMTFVVPARVQIKNMGGPLSINVFRGFSVPEKVVE